MSRGWKQVPGAIRNDWGKQRVAVALLALLITPLGCQEMRPLLTGNELSAGDKPGLQNASAAEAKALTDDSPGPLAQMVSETGQQGAGGASTSVDEQDPHPLASSVSRLMQQLSGDEHPERKRAAGDREAMMTLADGKAPSAAVTGGTPAELSPTSSPIQTAGRSGGASGKSMLPVAYEISAQTGGVVRAMAMMSGPGEGRPGSRPRGPGGLETLPSPAPLAEEEKDSKEADEDDFNLPASDLVIPRPCQTQLIDLSDAFGVASNQNPTIGLAQAEIGESVALLRQAQFLMLPTFRAGTNYHYHDGRFQASTGEIKSRDLQAFYIGGGARTLAAETVAFPMIQISTPLTDAWFEPLVARSRLDRSRFHLAATNNRILMEVADRYLDLVGAEARLLAVLQTEEEMDEVVLRTREYRQFGAGSESDERRAQTEANLMRVNEQRLQEEVAVASARLSRLLHLDPSVRLTTGSGPLKLFQLPPPCNNLEDLIQVALGNRPEIKEGAANVAMNQARYRRERARPFLPLLVFGYSAGSFGGGGLFYSVNKIAGNMGPRTDLDAMLIWNWQNFGLGNIALQRQECAAINVARADLTLAVNEVRREVTDSYATLQARQRQLELARQRLRIAHDGFDHDISLIRNQLENRNIRPIELLNSVTLLYQARQAFIAALVSYNQAELDLFVRLGRPPTVASPEVQTVLMPDSTAVNEHKRKMRQEQQPRDVKP